MPSGFCTLQAVFIALGNFTITGAVAAFSYMTYKIVSKPKTWVEQKHPALQWSHLFLLPVGVFPIVSTAIYIACVVRFKSVTPARDFFCDSSSPQWVRFMSYAGMPFVLSIPSLVLSIQSLHRARSTTKHIKRARTGEIDMDLNIDADAFTAFPSSSLHKAKRSELFDTSSLRNESNPSPDPSLRFAVPHGRSKHVPLVHFHLPMRSPSSDSMTQHQEFSLSSIPTLNINRDPRLGSTSTLPKAFSDSNPGTPAEELCANPYTRYSPSAEKQRWSESEIQVQDVKWNDRDEYGGSDTHSGMKEDGIIGETTESEDGIVEQLRRSQSRIRTHALAVRSRRPPPCYLSDSIWRMITFQIIFVIVQFIGCLSTLVDVAIHRSSPTPLGTHHFAMLFVVWGPIFAFGSLSSVRQTLFPTSLMSRSSSRTRNPISRS
ncbi:hypothetical protein BKA70DRAFT_202874 [Coprinopsis sp. MPI-PUGE-AT-0042]|nr:hypothetical protein BKA70DRAFT_202874 [Coprinopsis sp. MPI-PUGE-AT-0042]